MAQTLFLLAGLWTGMLGSSVGGSSSSDEKETSQLTNVRCGSEDSPIITEAYFLHQPSPSPCNDTCQPTTTSPKNSRTCFYDDELKCRIRVSLEDLNRIYKVLDSGDHQQLAEISRKLEHDNTKELYTVKYVCVAGRIVDPCLRTDQQDNNREDVTNLLLTPPSRQSGDLGPVGRPCHKLCRLTPLDGRSLKLVVNFLLNDAQRQDDGYLRYRIVNSTGHAAPWNKMTSSYQEDMFYINIKEIQVRLHLEDVSLVTRLWISLEGDAAFTLTCQEKGQTDDTSGPVSPSLTTPPELSTQDTLGMEREGDPVLPYATGASAVLAAILGIGLYIYCIRKRRSFEEVSSQQETQQSTVRASHYCDVTRHGDVTHHGDVTDHGDATAGSSRAQNLTTGDYCLVDVPNETGRGNDDRGEYGRLDRDGRRNEVGATPDHSNVYNHVAPLQPAASQQHPSSQQEAEVYDRLRRHPERQVVVDNVYDSTR